MRGLEMYGFQVGDWILGTPYRIVRPLGRGGMGEVYEVDHTRAGTRRAIKVLGARVSPNSSLAARLRVEGEALLGFEHPNVVRVYEVGALGDGRPFFAMELLAGDTLRDLLLRRRVLPLAMAVHIVLQALDGLDAAHARGMTHRDIKPGNLFVQRDGTVKLLDFGIVKLRGCCKRGVRTETGVVLGTRKYMAPEQMGGGMSGPQTDVFAAGVVLFELLTGMHPRDAQDAPTGSSLRWFDAPLPSLRAWAQQVPPGLDEVLSRAMLADPAARYGSARLFAEALREHVPVAPQSPPSSDGPLGFRASLSFSGHDTKSEVTVPRRGRTSRSTPRPASVVSHIHALGLALSVGAVVLAGLAAWSARSAVQGGNPASQPTCLPPQVSASVCSPSPDRSAVIGANASAR